MFRFNKSHFIYPPSVHHLYSFLLPGCGNCRMSLYGRALPLLLLTLSAFGGNATEDDSLDKIGEILNNTHIEPASQPASQPAYETRCPPRETTCSTTQPPRAPSPALPGTWRHMDQG